MTTLIFDFDGTLADSLPIVIGIANQVLNRIITPEEIASLRNMPAKDVIKYGGVPYWKIPSLLIKGKTMFSKRLKDLKVFDGIPEVIKALREGDYSLCVVSSNSEDNIRKILRRYRIEGDFSGVYGNIGLFTKAKALKKVLREQALKAEEAYYIGDEVRDVEAAKKAGVPVIAVTWGYNGETILKKYQPDFLVKTPQELLKILIP